MTKLPWLMLVVVFASACTGDDTEVDGVDGEELTSVASGVFDVGLYGALCDGTHDDAAAIRSAIAAAASAGGGIVHLPPGRCLIKSKLSLGGAVTLAGEGFRPPQRGGASTLEGSWLIVDASLLDSAAVGLAGSGATIRDLGIWHQQPAPSEHWRPRAFGWAIDMAVPDTLTRHVWLANPTLGIHGIGRTTIENVAGQPITTGIRIDGAYDVVRIRKVRFNWTADGGTTWSSSPAVTSQLGVGIESLRDDNPEIYDVKISGYATGIHFGSGPAGVTSKFSMMDTSVSNATNCVVIDGPATTGKLDRFWGRNCRSTGFLITGINTVVSGADLDLAQIGANGIRVEGANAQVLVNQVSIVDFDRAGAGFPAIEAASSSATVKVGLFRILSGGRVAVGGAGHVLVDNNGADAAFDLRIPTPTEIPESEVFPFRAKVSVMAHGARGNGTGDDTAAIQAALDTAAAGGYSNVLVPAGDYHLKGALKVPAGVTLVGVGWATAGMVDGADGTSPAGRPFKGSFFSIDASNTKDVVQLGDDSAIEGIGFRWNQGPVVAGWRPRGFGWAVRVTGTNVRVRDLFLLDPSKGIAVTSAKAGSVLIDRIFGSPQDIGLHLDTHATVRANDLHFWPFWGLAGAYAAIVRQSVEGHAIGVRSAHSAHAELSNVFTIFYQVGVLLSNSGGQVSTDLRLWNADQDIGVRGYVVSGPGTDASFANWSAQGDNDVDHGVTGLWVEPSATGAKVRGYNGDLKIFTGNAVRSDAVGSDIRVDLMRFEAWGSQGPFPVVEGGAAGPELWQDGR